jgi:carbonic anhydrase
VGCRDDQKGTRQYAVDVLRVRHIIVCGHFGRGGVGAALGGLSLGLSDHWVKHVRAVRDKHAAYLETIEKSRQFDRLCELNVIEQVHNVARTSILHDAWARHLERQHSWVDLRRWEWAPA